jgi:hypothetical protein
VWKVWSQPWSAWPRAFQGCFVILREVEDVDIVRRTVLGKADDMEKKVRKGVERARVSGRNAVRLL